MANFKDRFRELLNDEDKSIKGLVEYLQLSDASLIYQWKNGKKNPNYNSLINIANYFETSLDYLLGRSEDNINVNILPKNEFGEQLNKIIKEKKLNQYKMLRDKIITKGNVYDWFTKKYVPNMNTLIKLADYLNVTVDHLVGRE